MRSPKSTWASSPAFGSADVVSWNTPRRSVLPGPNSTSKTVGLRAKVIHEAADEVARFQGRRQKDLLCRRPMKEFVTGEGFTYLGRSHRLLLAADRDDPVKLAVDL
jgi:hypothetical protein